MPHIPRIPVNFDSHMLRKFIYKLTTPLNFEAPYVTTLDHYKKKQSRFFDTTTLPNEMKVTGSSKAQDLCTKAVHKLKEHPDDGVIVSASGSHVTKAVTVVELLKRRIPTLQQDTQLKYIKVEDVWEPDMEELDSLKVVRRIPAISMHLMEGSAPSATHSSTSATEQVALSDKTGKAATDGRERREKTRGQSSRSQGGGKRQSGKKVQSAGGHGRGKGRVKLLPQTTEVEDPAAD